MGRLASILGCLCANLTTTLPQITTFCGGTAIFIMKVVVELVLIYVAGQCVLMNGSDIFWFWVGKFWHDCCILIVRVIVQWVRDDARSHLVLREPPFSF